MSEDYYSILGIAPDSSTDIIKKAYREKARKYHPDKNPDNPDANNLFLNIKKAYDILSNPTERRNYDATRPRSSFPNRGRPQQRGDRVYTHTQQQANRQNPYTRPAQGVFRPSNRQREPPQYRRNPDGTYQATFNSEQHHNESPIYREFMERMKRNKEAEERMRHRTFFAAYDEAERERANDLFRRGQGIRAILVLTWETYHRVNTDRLKYELKAANLFQSGGGGKIVATVDFLKVAQALDAIQTLQRNYPSVSFRWKRGKPETLNISDDEENDSDVIELSSDDEEIQEVPLSSNRKRRRPASPVEIASSEIESTEEEDEDEQEEWDVPPPPGVRRASPYRMDDHLSGAEIIDSSEQEEEEAVDGDSDFEVLEDYNVKENAVPNNQQNMNQNGQSATYVIPDTDDENAEYNTSDEERLNSPRAAYTHFDGGENDEEDDADDEDDFKPMRFFIPPRHQKPCPHPEIIDLDD